MTAAPEDVAADDERDRLSARRVNRYFKRRASSRSDVLHSFSGVRPLYDDDADNPSAVTRDYVFELDARSRAGRRALLLSVFGGKITTFRKLAEQRPRPAKPFFPGLRARGRRAPPAGRRHSRCRFRAFARIPAGSATRICPRAANPLPAGSTAASPRRSSPTRAMRPTDWRNDIAATSTTVGAPRPPQSPRSPPTS